MMNVRERSLNFDEQFEIELQLEAGLQYLGLPAETTPDSIIYAISRFVENWQSRSSSQRSHSRRNGIDIRTLERELGVVWCTQVLRVTDWEWTYLNDYSLCIVPPQREYAISSNDFIARMMYQMMGGWWERNVVVSLFVKIKTSDLPPIAPYIYQMLETRTQF